MKRFGILIVGVIFAGCLNIYPQTSDLNREKRVEIKKTELRNVEYPFTHRVVNLSERDKQAIAMDPQDRRRFAGFLAQEDAGYVRLHEFDNCSPKNIVVNANEPCPWNVLGKAISYSFRKGKYQRASFSDIRLRRSVLEIVGVNLLGFLTDVGDADLNNLTLQSGGIREMAEFQPSSDIMEAERAYSLAKRGFKINDFIYKIALPIKENTTYALRAIAFDTKIYRKVRGFKVNLLENDKRRDVIVVFRVIRKHEDGSYSILWKELQRKSAPKLKTEKQILK